MELRRRRLEQTLLQPPDGPGHDGVRLQTADGDRGRDDPLRCDGANPAENGADRSQTGRL